MEAPAVALGGLAQAVAAGEIARDDCVLLSVTGGGWSAWRPTPRCRARSSVRLVPRSEAVDVVAEVADGLG